MDAAAARTAPPAALGQQWAFKSKDENERLKVLGEQPRFGSPCPKCGGEVVEMPSYQGATWARCITPHCEAAVLRCHEGLVAVKRFNKKDCTFFMGRKEAWKCAKCSNPDIGPIFCGHFDYVPLAGARTCECGEELLADGKFCIGCGKEIKQ